MPKYHIVRKKHYTDIPPPSGGAKKASAKKKKKKKTQSGGAAATIPSVPQSMLDNMGPPTDADWEGEAGVATAPATSEEGDESYPALPSEDIQALYQYVLLRKEGHSAEDANAKINEMKKRPPTQGETADDVHPAPQQQMGSGDDDGSGVILTTDEVIRVPQGDRHKVFSHPCQILVAGATMSGKTTLLKRILAQRDVMFEPAPNKIYWFYTMESSVSGLADAIRNVHLRRGVPTEDAVKNITKDGLPNMIVLDDMQSVVDDRRQMKVLSDILTKISHHGNLSIVFVVQNLYGSSANMRAVRSQCAETIIMCNGTSAMHNASEIGKHVLPNGGAAFMKDCLVKAKALSSHGHLLVSTGADTDFCNVRCGILPGDKSQTFFIQRGTLTTPTYESLRRHGEEGERAEEGRR